jgi:cytochrome c553
MQMGLGERRMKNPIVYFSVGVTILLFYAMGANDPAWSGNGNSCIGACFDAYVAQNGTPAQQEQRKQEVLAQASPAELGKTYYAQCVGCHGANGEGGLGPKLAGQAIADIVEKLSSYRAGETLGNQSMLMWSVAKPMTDVDINNLAEYVGTMK